MSEPPLAAERYAVLGLHAQGGLGQVSLARDERLRREVALKEIRPDRRDSLTLRARFLNEAEITAQLEHPGVAPVYDLEFDSEGNPRYAMRFIHGRTLREKFHAYHRRPSSLEFRALLQHLISVCQTVAFAHRRGVIHRDLKPANILLGEFGETLVADWGLAKRIGSSEPALLTNGAAPLRPEAAWEETVSYTPPAASSSPGVETSDPTTRAGEILGTLAYMAPEQARGDSSQAGPPADIYAMGAMLYELLTGVYPHQGAHEADIRRAIAAGAIPPPSRVNRQVPRPLEAICLKALALAPSQRYQDATELSGDLQRWLADEPVTAYREPFLPRARRWARRHKTHTAAAVALLATTLIVGGAGWSYSRAERARAESLGKIEALLGAAPGAVPALLDGLNLQRPEAVARLRELWNDAALADDRRLRVGLALLQFDPEAVRTELTQVLLQAQDPQEVLLLCERLAVSRAIDPAQWRTEVERAPPNDPHRLQRWALLAAVDPHAAAWRTHADQLVAALLQVDSLLLGDWSRIFRPARRQLIPSLIAIVRSEREQSAGLTAARVLANYAADDPAAFRPLLLESTAEQFAVFWPLLSRDPQTIGYLQQTLAEAAASENSAQAQAFRRATAAIAMARMGDPNEAWKLLPASVQPQARTYLIHRLAPLSTPPELLLDQLKTEPDASARAALLLALAEYDAAQQTPDLQARFHEAAQHEFRQEADPGARSAARRLLQRWRMELPSAREDPSHAPPPRTLDLRYWTPGPEGLEFAVLPAPPTPKSPAGGVALAVATTKVTLAQFRRFLQATPEKSYQYLKPEPGDAEFPAVQITWIQAARYCRWLSEQDGIATEECCFPPYDEIRDGMKLPGDYALKTGYRLPTAAEWAWFSQTQARSRFSCGTDDKMLLQYAWHMENSRRRLQSVGLLKPNDWGLFDCYGLAFEWCSDEVYFTPGEQERAYCGSSRFHEPDVLSSPPGSLANRPNFLANEIGFRVVRTWNRAPSAQSSQPRHD